MEFVTTAREVMDFLCIWLGWIETKDWTNFESVALACPQTFQLLSGYVSECEEFNGMTLLHAVIRRDPPLDLLQKMIELYPDAVKATDCLGRTPLHVAAGSGANAELVKILVVASPQTCIAQDEDLRTPLHFACDSSCELFDDDANHPRGPPGMSTVRYLLSGSQEATLLEDIDGADALEYAIMSDAPITVVNLLQKVSQKQHKKKSGFDPTGSLIVAKSA